MNTKHSPNARWIERGSLMLAGATLFGAPALATDPVMGGTAEEPALRATPVTTLNLPDGMESLKDALLAGEFWAKFRYRYENVDQSGFVDDAHASTLRTVLGYQTADFHGFTGVLEFSDVSKIGDTNYDYDEGAGNVARPVVADPPLTVVNQVYVDYTAAVGKIRLGRQRVNLDNQRFIGSVAFRQTEQTMDAISYDKRFDAGFRAFYSFVDNVNTVVGTNANASHHLLNLSYEFGDIGQLTAYGYYLDYENSPVLSTFTFGGSFVGEYASDGWGLNYRAELGHQTDVEDNPNSVDAGYSHVSLGGNVAGAYANLGLEILEGNGSADPNRSFQTPLATKWKFNGWADKFLITPAGGLEDTYLDIGWANEKFRGGIVLHQFEGERSSQADFGDEVDLYAIYQMDNGVELGARFAEFDAEDNTSAWADTQKFWLHMGFAF